MRDRLTTSWRAALAALVVAVAARDASAASSQPPTPRSADTSLSGSMSDTNPGRQVALAMQQMHLTVCAAAVQRAADFIFEGQNANVVAQPLGPDGDRWPTVFVIESADPAGGHTRLTILMVTPGCAGMYEQTIYWSQPCSTIKSTVFSKYVGEHAMLRDVKVSDAGAALQVYLTPAGAGCVSVKKELFR